MCAKSDSITRSTKKSRSMKVLLCPHKAQITIARLALTAFTDLLYLVRSVNRPFNDSERNSRPIIIPNRPPPFPKQLCSKVTAAITAGSRNGSTTPFKQVSFMAKGPIPLHRYHSTSSLADCIFRTSSTKTMSLAPLRRSPCFHLKTNSDFAVGTYRNRVEWVESHKASTVCASVSICFADNMF